MEEFNRCETYRVASLIFLITALVTSSQNKTFSTTLPIPVSLDYTDIGMLLYNFQSLMKIMKKTDIGECDSKIAYFRIACIVSKIWLPQVEEKEYDKSYHRQIDSPVQLLILSILLTFHRMRQGPDNFEHFVKIQIFLQFALCSVKAIINGAQPKAGIRYKMQTLSVIFSTLHCQGYVAHLKYMRSDI